MLRRVVKKYTRKKKKEKEKPVGNPLGNRSNRTTALMCATVCTLAIRRRQTSTYFPRENQGSLITEFFPAVAGNQTHLKSGESFNSAVGRFV